MSTDLYSLPPLHITRAEATALPAWSPGQPDALTTVHFRPNRSHDGMPDYRLTSACIDFLKRSYRADVITAGFLIGNAENGVITVHTAVPAPGLRRASRLDCEPRHFAPILQRQLVAHPGSQLAGIWYSLPDHILLYNHNLETVRAYAAALGGCLSITISRLPVLSASLFTPDGHSIPYFILQADEHP